MTMVWVVEGGWKYEGTEIIAICTTPEKADEEKEKVESKPYEDSPRYDFVEITAHILK
ncbi:TPA: hypothetical protein SIF59_004009 [Escherichia coli]|nr:hypothetical protein [Escherichia coli]HEI0663022.1 hypothetical protein [Escherichia coli]